MVRQPLRFRGLEKSKVQVQVGSSSSLRPRVESLYGKVQVQVYCALFQLIQYKIAYKISRLTNDQK